MKKYFLQVKGALANGGPSGRSPVAELASPSLDQRNEIGKVLENEEVRNHIKEYDRCHKKCF